MTKIESRGLRFVLAVIGVLLVSCDLAFAQRSDTPPIVTNATKQDVDSASDQNLEALRKDIRSMRKQIVAANLDLTDDQAEKFWPIYDQFTAELETITDTKLALIKDYAQHYSNMTDEQAVAYVKGQAEADEAVNRLRVNYLPTFSRVISGKTTAIFFQIESRVSLMIDLRLASQMPLIQP